MPLLPDPISNPNVKQLFLPKPDKDATGNPLPPQGEGRAWVKMDLRPTDGGDITKGLSNIIDPFGAFLVRRIIAWNFIDETGATLPITYENVLRIGKENIAYLAAQPLQSIDELTDDQKKTSTSTSTQ